MIPFFIEIIIIMCWCIWIEKNIQLFFLRLDRLDLEIHEVDHQELFIVDMNVT
jgi:hypothetical protein